MESINLCDKITQIMEQNKGGPTIHEVIPHIGVTNENYEIKLGTYKAIGGDIIQSDQISTLKELGLRILTVNRDHIYLHLDK